MGRTVSLSLLDTVEIASPCSADWAAMRGDDRSRFCSECKLHVYNIAGMTRDEAESLLAEAEGRLCVRLFRRADGTVLTQDCPVGWRRVRQKAIAASVRAAMGLAMLVGTALTLAGSPPGSVRLRRIQPFTRICEWLSPAPPINVPMGAIAMGKIAAPPTVPPKTPPSR